MARWSRPRRRKRPGRPNGGALAMAESGPGPHRVTLGADKNDDTRDCVRARRELRVTPHVAQHTTRRASAIDGWTTRHQGDTIGQRTRTCEEEVLGWLKTVGRLREGAAAWSCPGGVDVHMCRGGVQLGTDGYRCARGRKGSHS